jgi:hypothetical protein
MKSLRLGVVGLSRLLVLVPLLSLSNCEPKNALPPLLQNLEAKGGWADACPVPADLRAGATKLGLADSPEFDRRLQKEFPAGSPESHLIASLTKIGFHVRKPCEDDHTIHIARFDEQVQPGFWFSQ